MRKFDLSKYKSGSKIFLGILTITAIIASGFAVFELLSYNFWQAVILIVSLVVAGFAGKHKFTIPTTHLSLSPRKVLTFFGIIWLGSPGGVLLGAFPLLLQYRNEVKDKVHYFGSILISITASFSAGKVFYYIINNYNGFSGHIVGHNQISVVDFLSATLAMLLTHYLISTASSSIFAMIEMEEGLFDFWVKKYAKTLANYAIAAAGALIFHLAFLKFGIEFGSVVLVLTIVGHFAYRFHLKKLAQKTSEIGEAGRIHLATVEALATAIDARDQLAAGHVRRVQIYAVGMGELLELPEEEIDALRTGALLHDIGKLAVPDHILNKPVNLTEAEKEKMKIHASVGAAILEKVGFKSPVVPTVKYHHEWWNGAGYPEGLSGNNIPLTARILAVADTYDALANPRPYRPAISRDDSRKHLSAGSGTQFDSKLVDIFLRNLRRFEEEIIAKGLGENLSDDEYTNSLHDSSSSGSQSYVEQIKSANREVFTLYELATLFSASDSLEQALKLFSEKISEIIPFDTCLIYLLDEFGKVASVVYADGIYRASFQNKRIKVGYGVTGYVLKNREKVSNLNPALDFLFDNLEFIEQYTTMASQPLITDGKLIGAVSIYSTKLDFYADEHSRLLETVSRIAADSLTKLMQHAETESRALTDPMTGLPNARSLQIHFDKELARARRNETEFQLLMLDLDGFKKVNDTFGHKVGDVLLRELSKVMKAQLRDYDFLARYAGDEFVIIAPEMSSDDVVELCTRVEKAVCEFKLPVGDDNFAFVGVSLGAASYPHAGESLDQLIIAADKAMYRKKERNKMNRTIESKEKSEKDLAENAFIVELDESHIISTHTVN